MKKRSFFRFIKNKYTIVVLLILVVGGVYYVTHRTKTANFESAPVALGNVVEKVSVTGTVSPMEKADLSFQKSGVIASIPVKVGDHVAAGDVIAKLDDASDQAALSSAQATLADMSRSLTPEEMSVQQRALDAAKQSALNAVHDGYVKAQAALVNYTDSFFVNPQTVNPRISLRTDSVAIENNINNERVEVAGVLNQWSSQLPSVSTDTVASFVTQAKKYLATEKQFMNDLADIVGRLNPGNSGLTQTQIDGYSTTMNTALATFNSANDEVTNADTSLASAQATYDLKLAGNSSDAIAAQRAKVDQAQVAVANDTLVSPISGVVTKVDPSVGEFVAAGQSGFAVQSDSGYKIEAYVAEADIAKVAVGNKADVTLDAYGQYVHFAATVSKIDPAETVLEGVPTYKVTLLFDTPDSRIRSGMTANTDILTHEVDNVLTVQTRAVIDNNGAKSIRIVNPDGISYTTVPIETGLKGSDGTTQILSGVQKGDLVVTYTK